MGTISGIGCRAAAHLSSFFEHFVRSLQNILIGVLPEIDPDFLETVARFGKTLY